MSFLPRLALAASLLLSFAADAAELRGQIIAVQDGDTVTVITPERRQVRVRLHGIDTPERRQPYGTRARQEVSALAFRQQVRVVVKDVDRYGRTVGRLYAGPVDVNAELVRRGAAWVYRRYNDDPELETLEAQARRDRRGLWALSKSQRVPPWEWRRQRRN